MPNCHVTGPAGRAANAVEFSIGDPFDIAEECRDFGRSADLDVLLTTTRHDSGRK